MSIEKLLGDSTVLRNYSIEIDNFELIEDDIITLEIKQDFFNFGISGSLKIKDSFDVFNNGNIKFIKENKIKISFEDFLREKSSRYYYITKIRVIQHEDRYKILDISFIDEFTYILKNTYISKSFNKSTVSAFSDYLTHLGITDSLRGKNISLNINDTSDSKTFVAPQDRNILDFFLYELKRDNIRIWQDYNSINISEVIPAQMSLKQIDDADVLYSNRTLNNDYIFKIHEYEELNNQNYESLLTKPAELIYRYDTEKTIIKNTQNLVDIFSELKLNSLDVSSMQGNYKKIDTQATFGTDKQKHELFDSYMSNNQLSIVVPGSFKYNNIGFIVNVELKGNPLFADTEHEQDVYSSGKYFVAKVLDRIIGGRLIQKMTLIRLDALSPRKYK